MRLSLSLSGLALVTLMAGPSTSALAQNAPPTLTGANANAQEMLKLFPDRARSSQAAPSLIPKLEIDPDPSGAVATLQPNGPTLTASNAFFQDLGTNGRTCFTCHQPEDGWTVSAQHVQDRFAADTMTRCSVW